MSTKSATTVKYKRDFYSQCPKKIEDGSFPNNLLAKAKGNEFLTLERVKGISFIIVVDNKDIKIYSDKKSTEIVEFINKDLIRPIAKLIQYFESMDLSIYGEYLTHEDSVVEYIGPPKVFFYDMFINDNWLKNDDFLEIFADFKLPTPPVIRNGSLTQDYMNNLSKIVRSNSLINGLGEVYGVYVKSLDGVGEHRSISKGAYTFYNSKYVKTEKKKKPKENSELKKKVEELAYYTIDTETITRWEVILSARNIDKLKSNLDKIMPILVADYVNNHKEERDILALDEDIPMDEAERFIKKFVPKIIIEKLF